MSEYQHYSRDAAHSGYPEVGRLLQEAPPSPAKSGGGTKIDQAVGRGAFDTRGSRRTREREPKLRCICAAAAETYNLPIAGKHAVLECMLALNPIDRIRKIAGEHAELAIARYADFLAALSDKDARAELETLDPSYVEKAFKRLWETAGLFERI